MLAVLGTLMVPTVPCVARKRCAVLAFAVYRATRPKVAHCLLFLLAGRGAPELTTSSLPRRLGLVQLSAIEPAHFTAAWCFLAPPTHHTDHFLSVLSACVKPQASIVTWHSTGHICSRPGLAVSSAMIVVWRREAALQSDRGFITPAVRPAVAGALWVPVQTNTDWRLSSLTSPTNVRCTAASHARLLTR